MRLRSREEDDLPKPTDIIDVNRTALFGGQTPA